MGRSKDLASGASYVDTSGDTMTGNLLLGSNSIGLGTTSPDAKIHVEGSILVDAFNAGNETGIFFREGFTSSNKYNHSILAYDDDGSPDGISINGYGGVSICTGSNSRQERFKVDSSGRVTTPNQPMFAVKNTETANGYTQTYLQSWSTVQVNRGSHWDSSTGRFTAPVAGTYYFAWWVQEESYYGQWGSSINAGFHKNGSEYISFGNGGIADDASEAWFTMSALITLSANDYVTLRFDCNDTAPSFEGGQGQFYGYLIG